MAITFTFDTDALYYNGNLADTRSNPAISYIGYHETERQESADAGASDIPDTPFTEENVPYILIDSESGATFWAWNRFTNQHTQYNFFAASLLQPSPFQGFVRIIPYFYNYDDSCFLATNIPCFSVVADVMDWIGSQFTDNSKILNFYYDHDVETDSYYINNVGLRATWTTGNVQTEEIAEYYRYATYLVAKDSKLALYPIEGIEDSALKYGIIREGDIILAEKSIDGGLTWDTLVDDPFAFYWRPRIDELGTFTFSPGTVDTNIPIFEDEETAQLYVDDDPSVNITDALNWNDISSDYDITNGTEEGETSTTMGECYARSIFSQQYILSENLLGEIANSLFDTSSGGVWEDIKKGLDMFGENPIQAVQSLTFWPVDLSTVFTNYSSQNYVYFGGFKLDLTGAAKKIIYPNGYKSMGSMRILPHFRSYLDYEPYTKLYVQLPYIGTYQLELNRYYGKSTEVRYYFDTRTGSVVACLLADGILMDYFNGQMGVQYPITLTDYAEYAAGQIQTLLGGGQAMGSALSNAPGAATGLAAGLPGAGAGALGLIGGGAFSATMTAYNLSQNTVSDHNKTVGGSSSMLNTYLPQYVQFIFVYLDTKESENLQQLYGRPSNASGTLGSFSGFLQVESANIKCPIATESERNRIVQMLLSGIYI